jgi:hypothetical protein
MVDIAKAGILPNESGAFRAGDSTGPVVRGNMEQAWLRELERAQWSQRPAAGSKPEAPHSGEPRPGEDAPRPGLRARSGGAPGEPGEVSARREPVAPSHATGGRQASPSPGGSRPSPGRTAAPAAPSQAPGEQAASERPSALEAMIEARLWGEMRVWERRKALVLERGGRVRVWLRDASLSPDAAAQTVAHLERLMREAGLLLEVVTLNGSVVFEANGS